MIISTPMIAATVVSFAEAATVADGTDVADVASSSVAGADVEVTLGYVVLLQR